MKRLPHFLSGFCQFPVGLGRVGSGSGFTAACPLASFVTGSLIHRQRSHVLEDSIRYIKQSLTSWIKKYYGTSQSRQLFSRWPDFSSVGDAGRYSFICFSSKMSFSMSSHLHPSLPQVAWTFRKFESKTFYSTVLLLQYHWYQYPLLIKARPPNDIAGLLSSMYMVLGLEVGKKRRVSVYVMWFRNGMFNLESPLKPIFSPPVHSSAAEENWSHHRLR